MSGPLGETSREMHMLRIQSAGRNLCNLLRSEEPERFRNRRRAVTNKIAQHETEYDLSDTGAVSGSNVVFEVRLGMLHATNDFYRGQYDGYMLDEAIVEAAIESVKNAVAEHPDMREKIRRDEFVLGVLYEAARTVYTAPPKLEMQEDDPPIGEVNVDWSGERDPEPGPRHTL